MVWKILTVILAVSVAVLIACLLYTSLPMCSSQRDLFCEIYNPSNSDLSVPISKNERNMLIPRVFPKRLGINTLHGDSLPAPA